MMRPLRGLVICEDPDLRARVQTLLLESGDVEPALVLHRYPEASEAARQIRLCRPEIIILAIERLQPVIGLMRGLEGTADNVPAVGVSRMQDPRALAELMRYGIRDCIQVPLNGTRFHDAMRRIAYSHRENAGRPPIEPLISFVPARGGSGASTLACNLSHSLSRMNGSRVLLADFDMTSGLSRFLFKLTPASSLGELIEIGYGARIDWRRCVASAGALHVVHLGGVNPKTVFTPAHARQVIECAAPQYNAICADLTGSMETYSLELLRRSRRIVLVTNTEIPSIGLARDKIEFLSDLELDSRIGVVLTVCAEAPAPDASHIQRFLRVPVDAVLDFGDRRDRRALAEGNLLNPKTGLGRQIEQFARELASRVFAGAARASC